MRASICVAVLLVLAVAGSEASQIREALSTGRKLRQTVNFQYGTKQTIGAPCENYYSLKSRGGPDSSLVGEYQRKTAVKVGCPPAEPIFRYSYDPKRSDIGGKDGAKDGAKDGGKDAKKAGPKRMLSSVAAPALAL